MLSARQLLIIWLSFLGGIVLADQFVVTAQFYILVLVLALLAGLLWRRGNLVFKETAVDYKNGNALVATATPPTWLTVSFASLLLLAGVIRMEWAEQQFVDSAFVNKLGQSISITGAVVREPDVRESFTQLYVQVEDETLLVRTDRFSAVRYGDVLAVTGRLQAVEPFITDTGRIFDYPNYLKVRGVQHVVSFADVTVVESGGGNVIVRGLYSVKDRFAAAVTASLPPPESDLGLGLLLGIKQALGQDLETAFRHTGLIHIVVLSGYNVMLVVAFFWWVTSWVLPLQGRVVASLIGIVLFASMVGLSATVVRASIMASILLLAKYIGTRYDVMRALLFAGFIMVLINPYLLLYDLGFQLSFMATLGLVLFLPQFEGTVATNTRSLGLRDIFFATLITQLFVLPLLIFHIGEISLVAIVVNVLVLPIVAVAMTLTFLTGLASLVSTTAAFPIALLAELVLSYIITVVRWFAALPFAAVVVPPVSLSGMFMLYGLLGLLWYVWLRSMTVRQTHERKGELADWQIVEEADVAVATSALASDSPAFWR